MTSEGDATDSGDTAPTSFQDSEDESECPLEVKTLPPLLPLHEIRIAPPEFIKKAIETLIREARNSRRVEIWFHELRRLAIAASFAPPTEEAVTAVVLHIAKPNWNLRLNRATKFVLIPVDK